MKRFGFAMAVAVLVSIGPASPRAASAPAPLETDPALRARVEAQGESLVVAIALPDSFARRAAVSRLFAEATIRGDGAARMAALLGRLRERYGALAFHHAEVVARSSEAGLRASLHVFVRCASDDRWRDIQLMLDPEPPHRLQTLVFIADVSEPVYLPNGDLEDTATLDWLHRYVEALARKDDFSGGLLITRGDRVVFEHIVGFADSARRRPLHRDTRFDLASGGKLFTALAVAQLVEQGRLAWSDSLVGVVPSLASQPFARGVTVEQLLAHTSGIGEMWTPEYERHWNDWRTLSDIVPWIARAGRDFEPGTDHRYSNSNFILAGLVIEAVTGKAWDHVFAERFFRPLALTRTGAPEFTFADTTIAERLTGQPHKWRRANRAHSGSTAGGTVSTLHDMERFARAILRDRLVRPETLERMTRAAHPAAAGEYGLGFELATPRAGPRAWGHGGQASGSNFELRVFPELDLVLVAYCNQDNGAFDDLKRNAIRLITGER